VLFLIALSQRFKLPNVRTGLVVVALVIMIYAFIMVALLSRL
jgi:hypothetical protein